MLEINKVMSKNQPLIEGERRDFMTDQEKKLKWKLIRLLKDKHHAGYAKRLEKYDINIVPLGKQPETAAISFEEGIIYINMGFLRDQKTFEQLDVIIRHELCHNLMMHQFRMIQKLKNIIPEISLSSSSSIHQLLNTLEDFEISNKKYSAADKEIVKNTWLNGKIISGLVTEDHRENWLNMSLEQMYDAIEAEMDKYNNTGQIDKPQAGKGANLNQDADNLYKFRNALNRPVIARTLKDFEDIILYNDKKYDKDAMLANNYKSILDGVENVIIKHLSDYTEQDIEKMIKSIYESKAISKQDIVSPVTGEVIATVYSPEEKEIALECLKIAGLNVHDYQRWYKEIIRKLQNSNYSAEQLKELAAVIK